jgi:hypothetical protein
MIRSLTSSYRDWGFIALGFSAAAAIEIILGVWSAHGTPAVGGASILRLVCGAAVGPLVVWSLLLDATIPHRIVLVMGGIALVGYVVLGVR